MLKISSLLLLSLFLSSCAHVVTDDYDRYLNNNKGTPFPPAKYSAEYTIDPTTKTHEYKFNSAMAGAANSWIVKFGDLLEKTMQSEDVQKAFGGIKESGATPTPGKRQIKFMLVDYQFRDKKAFVKMLISVRKDEKNVFEKSYSQEGNSQGGKMFWAGAAGMKNAVHQSTKAALDKILTAFISDSNAVK